MTSFKSSCRALLAMPVLLLWVAGCDSSSRPPGSRVDPIPKDEYGKIQVIDELQPWLLFREAVVDAPGERQALRVEQPVRSNANYAINVQYRFEFFDAQTKLLTPPDSGWQYLTMEPKLDYRMTGISPDKDAVDWRLTVRPAR